jgi:hypothetical protein
MTGATVRARHGMRTFDPEIEQLRRAGLPIGETVFWYDHSRVSVAAGARVVILITRDAENAWTVVLTTAFDPRCRGASGWPERAQ